MATYSHSYWSFALDGGAVGAYELRGAQIQNGAFVVAIFACCLEDLTGNPGATIALGMPSDPTAFFGPTDISFLATTAPSVLIQPFPNAFHFAAREPFLLTVGTADLTGGLLELLSDIPSLR